MKEQIITTLKESTEVQNLPTGAVVGDLCGGRSFNDNVAAALERRSQAGWRDHIEDGQRWTLIKLIR